MPNLFDAQAKAGKVAGGAAGYKPSFWEVLDGVLGGETITESRFNAKARNAALADAQEKSAMQKRIMALLAGDEEGSSAAAQPPGPSQSVPQMPRRIGPALDEGLPEPASAVTAPMPALPSQKRFNPDKLQQILAAAAYGGDAGATKAAEVLDKLRPQLEKGQYIDQDGRVRNRDGFVAAQSELTGATTSASEGAKAQFDVIAVPLPDGSSVQMPRGVYIQLQKSGALPDLGRSQTPGAREAQVRGASAPYDFVDATDAEGRPMKVAKSSAAGQTFVGQSPAENQAAKSATEALDALPGLLSTARQGMAVINQIKTHPEFANRVGWKGALPTLPGTAGVDFDSMVDQLKGKVFLEAFNGLRGGGQITEAEGAKAQQALARLNQKQTPEGFSAALNDLYAVFRSGSERAAKSAQGGSEAPAARRASPAAAPRSGGYSVVGVRRAGQ